jgi:tellurite resistance protein
MSGDITPIESFDEPKLEALVEIMVLAASADGDFADDERARLASAVESLTSRKIAPEKLPALLKKLERQLEEEGREKRLTTVRERLGTPAERKIALELALRVMMADGILRTSERELVLDTAEALEIDRDVAADMVRAALGG